MAVIPGHRCSLLITGTPTAMVTEACTEPTTTTAQITNAARRLLDPAALVTVYDNAVELASTNVTVDYLTGTVTLTSGGNWAGQVTVSANYLPTLTVAEVRSFSISLSREELEDTVMGDSNRTFVMGLKTAEGTIEGLDMPNTDLDPGGGTVIMETLHDAGTPKLLEFCLNPDLPKYFRAWVIFPGIDVQASFDALAGETIKWRAAPIVGSGQTETARFGFGG